jgi:hypothetical protein
MHFLVNPVERNEHGVDSDLFRRLRQFVATKRTASTANEPGPIQGAKNLMQVGLRNLLAKGNVTTMNWTLTRAKC